jgi:hypothetical protein
MFQYSHHPHFTTSDLGGVCIQWSLTGGGGGGGGLLVKADDLSNLVTGHNYHEWR